MNSSGKEDIGLISSGYIAEALSGLEQLPIGNGEAVWRSWQWPGLAAEFGLSPSARTEIEVNPLHNDPIAQKYGLI